MKKLHLEIVSPERQILTDEVDMVVVPASQGDVGILPDHTPFFSRIRSGEIMVRKGQEQYFLAITGGYLEVLENNVNILADYAVRAEEVEVARAEEAKKRAERLMSERTTREDFAIAEGELRRALIELKVARKRRVRG